MTKSLLLSFFLLVSLITFGQEIKYPLEDKVKIKAEDIPAPPFEDAVWVKPHWEFQSGKYVWLDGTYIEPKEGHKWMDGYWKRNSQTGWWVFNMGYWQKDVDNVKVNSGGQIIYDSKEKISNANTETKKIMISGGTSSNK